MIDPVLSLHFFYSPAMRLQFYKDKEKLLLFVCRAGMWETPSVFHIPARFSFFASFFFLLPLSFC